MPPRGTRPHENHDSLLASLLQAERGKSSAESVTSVHTPQFATSQSRVEYVEYVVTSGTLRPPFSEEPGPKAGGDPISQDGPTGSGRIADLHALALACTLVILLAGRLSAAIAGPIGRPSVPADGRSGPAAAKVDSERCCRFESAYRRQSPVLIGPRTTRRPSAPVIRLPGGRVASGK